MSLIVDIEKKLGSFTLHSKFETGSGTMALLGAALPKDPPAEPGQTIRFDLLPESCLCYPPAQTWAAAL